MNAALKVRLLDSVLAQNLVLVCGAGLSRSAPSNLPSAQAFAEDCYDRYIATGGVLNVALRSDLESQARHFFLQHQLELVFIGQVVDWGRFVTAPNKGHTAIADLLCCRAVVMTVSTNYDELIERAAEQLGEKALQPSISVVELNHAHPMYNALLKLHGCKKRNPSETIWCPDQITAPPAQQRIGGLAAWLGANLQGRDFVFLGFWSDWAYLNRVLEESIRVPYPTSVTLVDPAPLADLNAKAPALLAWAQTTHFAHEQISANDFLDELRIALSERFFRESFNAGVTAYTNLYGIAPAVAAPSPAVSSERWYDVRRDLTGVDRDGAVRDARPSGHVLNAGLALVELNERAVALTEDGFRTGSGKLIRVVGTAGPLSLVKQKHSSEPPSRQLEDLVICACATEDPGVTSVVRPTAGKTIVRRGVRGTWATLNDGLAAI